MADRDPVNPYEPPRVFTVPVPGRWLRKLLALAVFWGAVSLGVPSASMLLAFLLLNLVYHISRFPSRPVYSAASILTAIGIAVGFTWAGVHGWRLA